MAEMNLAPNFVQNAIEEDLKNGKYTEGIHTRFPPEPNGYLHVGHAKSICLNFGLAERNHGLCNLRFDDTNPTKEDTEYVDSIQEDIKWLGFSWGDRKFYASDYFDKLYHYAEELICKGLAYVDDLPAEEIKEYRGTLTEPGKESPYRDRSVQENLDLFRRMKAGEFPDGAKVLRAKIDMASPNIVMRDTVIYRIAHAEHHRTGNEWCIYPMYDFAHPLSDAIEGITHSVCTLEFEDHRPFYDWLLESLGFDVNTRPRQIEFARLNLTNTVTSKRKLRQLVEEGHVRGWDDPRMPTISGLRRRGYTPASLRKFCEEIGVAKGNSLVDVAMLEHCVRDDLNENASRVMAVLHPLKVVLVNYPEDKSEYLLADNNPMHGGSRFVPFSREIFIEQEDFMEEAPKKFFRLKPGGEVRLKHAYIIKCEEVIKDEQGQVIELRCSCDMDSKSGGPTSNRKIKGTIHWVEAKTALKAEVRLYDYLLETDADGNVPADFIASLNKKSLEVVKDALIEPSVKLTAAGTHYQFLRMGYFVVDPDTTPDHLVFNRVVGLRDSWAKAAQKG
ncbi:MAG: glutamine--tRNA ligase/YqeY domain fusion protein [Selenomonadaceae bacterium]|nr:glutamine--tRNA ligase/YqeY domain fusion protein [Selenomonadaceae bacterium]